MLRLVAATGVAAVLLAACGGGSGSSTTSSASSTSGTSGSGATSTTLDISSRVKTYTVPSRNHVTGHVNYPQTPPVGGDHNPVWQNCGFYSQPIVTEMGVHSMEHGAVWITYRPGLPSAQVTVLRNLAKTPSVLVSPWADSPLPAAVVASAWGVQLTADSASDPAIAAFVVKYAHGPQTPEPAAPCTGGFGTPG